jgi:hypothetical protein
MTAPTNTNSRVIARWIDQDGAPLTVTITGLEQPSKNAKTGDMLQVAIMRADKLPSLAARDGADRSVCGSCQLRPYLGNKIKCYVKLWRSFNGIWRSVVATGAAVTESIGELIEPLQRCSEPGAKHSRRRCAHKTGKPLGVRLGSYGDPSFIDIGLIRELCPTDRRQIRTGYTHRWREIPIAYADYMMASLDPETDPNRATAREEANAAGWSTYAVLERGEAPSEGSVLCPHTTHGIACADCGLCAGALSWSGSGKRRARPINIEVVAI